MDATLGVLSFMTGAITSVLLLISAYASKSIIKGMMKKQIKPRNGVGSLLTLYLFLLCALFFFLFTVSQYFGQILLFRVLGGACYVFAQLSMIFTFIARICVVFDNSILHISNRTAKALYFTFFILMVLGVSAVTILYSGGNVVFFLMCALLWILFYLGLSVTLVGLFIHKLRFLMSMRSKPLVNTPASPHSTASLIDMELLYVVIKNAILVPTAITSSVVFSVISITMNMLSIVLPQIIVLDCLVTSLCIFLLFTSSKPVYDRLCWSCHDLCQRCQLGEGVPSKMNRTSAAGVDISRLVHGRDDGQETVRSGTDALSIESRAYTVSTPLGKSSSTLIATPVLTKYSSNPV
eukprot:107431_1